MGNQCGPTCAKKQDDMLFRSSSRSTRKHCRSDAGIKSSISYENAPYNKN